MSRRGRRGRVGPRVGRFGYSVPVFLVYKAIVGFDIG